MTDISQATLATDTTALTLTSVRTLSWPEPAWRTPSAATCRPTLSASARRDSKETDKRSAEVDRHHEYIPFFCSLCHVSTTCGFCGAVWWKKCTNLVVFLRPPTLSFLMSSYIQKTFPRLFVWTLTIKGFSFFGLVNTNRG